MTGFQVCAPCKRYFELLPSHDASGAATSYFEWQCPVCFSTTPEATPGTICTNADGNQVTPEERAAELRAAYIEQLERTVAEAERTLNVVKSQLQQVLAESLP